MNKIISLHEQLENWSGNTAADLDIDTQEIQEVLLIHCSKKRILQVMFMGVEDRFQWKFVS